MPPTIHALLAARIERLRPDERSVLERAAVVGRHFSRGAVAALLRRNGGELDARLEALRRSELIEPDSGWFLGEPMLRFHHVLIRDAAYRRLLKGTRAELHARFAEWVAARAGEARSRRDHRLAPRAGAPAPARARSARRAGRRARRPRGAPSRRRRPPRARARRSPGRRRPARPRHRLPRRRRCGARRPRARLVRGAALRRRRRKAAKAIDELGRCHRRSLVAGQRMGGPGSPTPSRAPGTPASPASSPC